MFARCVSSAGPGVRVRVRDLNRSVARRHDGDDRSKDGKTGPGKGGKNEKDKDYRCIYNLLSISVYSAGTLIPLSAAIAQLSAPAGSASGSLPGSGADSHSTLAAPSPYSALSARSDAFSPIPTHGCVSAGPGASPGVSVSVSLTVTSRTPTSDLESVSASPSPMPAPMLVDASASTLGARFAFGVPISAASVAGSPAVSTSIAAPSTADKDKDTVMSDVVAAKIEPIDRELRQVSGKEQKDTAVKTEAQTQGQTQAQATEVDKKEDKPKRPLDPDRIVIRLQKTKVRNPQHFSTCPAFAVRLLQAHRFLPLYVLDPVASALV